MADADPEWLVKFRQEQRDAYAQAQQAYDAGDIATCVAKIVSVNEIQSDKLTWADANKDGLKEALKEIDEGNDGDIEVHSFARMLVEAGHDVPVVDVSDTYVNLRGWWKNSTRNG